MEGGYWSKQEGLGLLKGEDLADVSLDGGEKRERKWQGQDCLSKKDSSKRQMYGG